MGKSAVFPPTNWGIKTLWGSIVGKSKKTGLKTPKISFIVPNIYFFTRYNLFLHRNAKIFQKSFHIWGTMKEPALWVTPEKIIVNPTIWGNSEKRICYSLGKSENP